MHRLDVFIPPCLSPAPLALQPISAKSDGRSRQTGITSKPVPLIVSKAAKFEVLPDCDGIISTLARKIHIVAQRAKGRLRASVEGQQTVDGDTRRGSFTRAIELVGIGERNNAAPGESSTEV